jgi:hypothetical protein
MFPVGAGCTEPIIVRALEPRFCWREGSMSVGPVARGVAVAIGISFVAVVTVAIVARFFMMVF